MNWYKIALQKSFPFMEEDLTGHLSPNSEWDSWWDKNDCENALEKIEDSEDLEEKLRFIKMCAEDIDEIFTPSGKILSFKLDGKIYILEDNAISEAHEWLSDQVIYGRVEDYITSKDFNKEFWDEIDNDFFVYHGTSEERLNNILKNGLQPRDETRGIANRSTGAGVFTSSEPETPQNYYDIVLEINIGLMKRDEYMPNVSMEEPLQEAIAEEALASLIGIKDYYAEREQGLDEGTIIFYGGIPPKYIKVLE